MSDVSSPPDLSDLEIPIDSWTQPFWEGTAVGRLLLPRCSVCPHYRWPPGPFCPHCQSQLTEWVPPSIARIYSFTVVPAKREDNANQLQFHVPALIEFPEADGIRLVAAIVNTRLEAIRIGAQLKLGWSQAANVRVPVFSIP
jgi:uncharacterized OB-fold protein